MAGTADFGRAYWYIELTSGEGIHLFADKLEILPNGDLVAWRMTIEKDGMTGRQINFTVASGQWKYSWLATILDGGAHAIEHWHEPKPESLPRRRNPQ